jgi:hypothetical protein
VAETQCGVPGSYTMRDAVDRRITKASASVLGGGCPSLTPTDLSKWSNCKADVVPVDNATKEAAAQAEMALDASSAGAHAAFWF